MREVHPLNNDARDAASQIQQALDRFNAEDIDNFPLMLNLNAILQIFGTYLDDATYENLISGATFTINNQGSHSDDNSLIHVAIYAQVKQDIMQRLLNLGVKYSAELHANSKGLTPIEYAEQYFANNLYVSDILTDMIHNTIIGYGSTASDNQASFYDCGLVELVKAAVEENNIYDNNNEEITINLVEWIKNNSVRSLFNSCKGIEENIQTFIDLSECASADFEYCGTHSIIFSSEGNDIRLLAEQQDIN